MVAKQLLNRGLVSVWQQERLRWLDFGDGAVQSIIDIDHPDQLISPVYHAMLAPMLFVPVANGYYCLVVVHWPAISTTDFPQFRVRQWCILRLIQVNWR